ncbi:hypothetical protein ABPG74_011111 [Tetrahymena malaccensis]
MDSQAAINYNQFQFGYYISKEVVQKLLSQLPKTKLQFKCLEYFQSQDFSLTLKGKDLQNNEDLAIRINLNCKQSQLISVRNSIMNRESDITCLYQFDFENVEVKIFNYYDYIYSDQEFNESQVNIFRFNLFKIFKQLLKLAESNLKYVRCLIISYDPKEMIEKNDLFKCISHCLNIKKLSLKLEVSNLFHESSQFLQMIKKLSQYPKLVDLVIEMQEFQADFQSFYAYLSQIKSLKKLSIKCFCKGNQVESIVNLLNSQSRILNLDLNFKGIIKMEQANQISQVFFTLKDLQSVNLNLENTSVSYETFENIVYSLSNCTKLNTLNLNFCIKIKDITKSIKRELKIWLITFLNAKNQKIQNQIYKEQQQVIVQPYRQDFKLLKQQVSIFRDVLYQKIYISICCNFYLIVLCQFIFVFSYNGIRSEGLNLFSEGLQNCQNLKSLILLLGNNNIDDTGYLQQFSQSISKLKNLEQLILDFNGNKLNHIQSFQLSQGISFCNSLKELSLKFNNNCIGVEGAQSLGKSLGSLENILQFNLQISKNKITDNGLISLSQGINQIKNLQSLNIYLVDNQISELGLEIFFSNLCSLKNLYYLSLDLNQNQFDNQALFRRQSSLFKLFHIRQLFLSIQFHKDIQKFRTSIKRLTRLILGQIYC